MSRREHVDGLKISTFLPIDRTSSPILSLNLDRDIFKSWAGKIRFRRQLLNARRPLFNRAFILHQSHAMNVEKANVTTIFLWVRIPSPNVTTIMEQRESVNFVFVRGGETYQLVSFVYWMVSPFSAGGNELSSPFRRLDGSKWPWLVLGNTFRVTENPDYGKYRQYSALGVSLLASIREFAPQKIEAVITENMGALPKWFRRRVPGN